MIHLDDLISNNNDDLYMVKLLILLLNNKRFQQAIFKDIFKLVIIEQQE